VKNEKGAEYGDEQTPQNYPQDYSGACEATRNSSLTWPFRVRQLLVIHRANAKRPRAAFK